MREPSPRTSRLAIAGGLLAVLCIGGGGFLLGRGTLSPPPPVTNEVVAVPTPPEEPPPAETRTLGRADLAALAGQAADAAASGTPVPASVREAVGRQFDLELPFGCGGPANQMDAAPLSWSYNETAEVLRIRVQPTTWAAADWGIAAEAGVEAIEGFWIPRPWSSRGTCPPRTVQAAVAGSEPVMLPGQTLALAQFVAGDGRREALRGERPFELVQRMPRAEFDGSQGFRVRLLGRIGSVAGTGPVRCLQPAGIEQRPICVIAATLAEVRIENPADGAVLATWPIGGDSRAN